MADKKDIAAEKAARKQKIVLAVAGLALVGLAVIQVPKLMKSDSAPTAAPVAETTTAAAATPTVPSTTGSTAKPAGFVAGVGLPGTRVVPPAKSQLASFTLFQPSDPFVQQVGDETATGEATPAAEQPAADPAATGAPAATSGDGSSGSATTPAAEKPAFTHATVMLDGKPQQLQVKDKFPKNDPMFVLVSLKKKQAKIGVAGGTFDDGQTVTLSLGKMLTLLNTATGVRYELKLVYTGSQPETIEGFSTKAEQPATAPADGGSTVSVTP